MVEGKQLQQIEEALFESGDWLRTAQPGPAVRELRVRYGALLRVVGTWATAPPHADQLAAMLECVNDLCAAIARTCGPVARNPSKLGRRTGRPSSPGVRPSARPSARPSGRPGPRQSAPPLKPRSAAGHAMRPGPMDAFERTTRPPPPRK
ncbi:MAG: hypothetical protein ACLP1X_14705 [Polyangiaceae bacterium]|jgi:hypothetical protein